MFPVLPKQAFATAHFHLWVKKKDNRCYSLFTIVTLFLTTAALFLHTATLYFKLILTCDFLTIETISYFLSSVVVIFTIKIYSSNFCLFLIIVHLYLPIASLYCTSGSSVLCYIFYIFQSYLLCLAKSIKFSLLPFLFFTLLKLP